MLPISDKYMDYAEKVVNELKEAGIRVEIDTRAEKIGYKIREARLQKIPFICWLLVAKEEEEGKVSVEAVSWEMKVQRILRVQLLLSKLRSRQREP